MAGSLNRVTLLGNLGADPEARQTTSGGKVVTLRVATSQVWKDKQTGERRERTEWHQVVIFNDGLAGVAEQYLRKGGKVFVEGELRTRKWQAQDGTDRYATEVVVPQFGGQLILLGTAGGGRPAPDESAYGTTRPRDDRPAGNGSFGGDMDDEIPF